MRRSLFAIVLLALSGVMVGSANRGFGSRAGFLLPFGGDGMGLRCDGRRVAVHQPVRSVATMSRTIALLPVLAGLLLTAGCGGDGIPRDCPDQRCAPAERSYVVVAAHRYAGMHTFYWLAENGDSAGGVTSAGGLDLSVRSKGYSMLPRGSSRISQQVGITSDIDAMFEIITYIKPPTPNPSVYGEHYEPTSTTVHLLLRRRMPSGETVEVWGSGLLFHLAGNHVEYAKSRAYVEAHIAPVDPKLYDELSDFQKGK